MAKSQNTRSGFVIKLSDETVQKLTEEEENKLSDASEALAVVNNTSSSDGDLKNLVETVENSQNIEVNSEDKSTNQNQEPSSEVILREVKSDNVDTTKDSSESWGEYAPYVSYEGEEAIYTDPTSGQKYTWDKTKNSWEAKESPESSGRVYSYENDTHIYTETDGSKYFWDVDKKAWIPKIDDEFLAKYQLSYGFLDHSENKKEDAESKKEPENKKEPTAGVKRKTEPQWFEQTDDKNTKVYVSNLPLDLTEEEFVDFMQKCGLVERDPSSQKMKIKMYTDKELNCFKGDALCTYIKIESVDLALKLLDGMNFKGNTVKVERAHFQLKGEYNPALKPKKRKKKELEKIKRMKEKLFDWRPEKFIGERSKHEKVVIVKNLFHPSDFDNEVQLILDYQQDLREECGKCGDVRKVVIYDRHPEGVAQITMKEPEQADAVVLLINGRWFGKRQITAEIWDGKTKYKIAETDADINQRLDKWGKFLEGKDDQEKVKSTENKDNSSESIAKQSTIETKDK